jgi:hypothetical protein
MLDDALRARGGAEAPAAPVAIAVLALLTPLALVVDPLALSAVAAAVTVTLAVILARESAPTRS